MEQLYKQIWNKIKESKKIVILTHINPDGDTIGTAVALKHLILDNTDIKEVKISGSKVPSFLSTVDENEDVSDEFFNEAQVIVVDTSNKRRVFDQRVITEETIKIDHHHEEEKWLLGVGGDHWPATGEVLFELAIANELEVSKRVMEALFIAIWTDTSGLTQRNISERTIELMNELDVDKTSIIKSLQPPKHILELIEELKKEIVVDQGVAVFISKKEIENEYLRLVTDALSTSGDFKAYIGYVMTDENYMRGSLRSKNIDVSVLAKKLGGGGHESSAGFRTIKDEELKELISEIKNMVNP